MADSNGSDSEIGSTVTIPQMQQNQQLMADSNGSDSDIGSTVSRPKSQQNQQSKKTYKAKSPNIMAQQQSGLYPGLKSKKSYTSNQNDITLQGPNPMKYLVDAKAVQRRAPAFSFSDDEKRSERLIILEGNYHLPLQDEDKPKEKVSSKSSGTPDLKLKHSTGAQSDVFPHKYEYYGGSPEYYSAAWHYLHLWQPELSFSSKYNRAPSYSLSSRVQEMRDNRSPGPCYSTPSLEVTKSRAPAYSF